MPVIVGSITMDRETGNLYTDKDKIRERIEYVFSENARFKAALKRIRDNGILCEVCPKDCSCPHCVAKRALELG